jgi:hypothetical protein
MMTGFFARAVRTKQYIQNVSLSEKQKRSRVKHNGNWHKQILRMRGGLN